MYTQVGKRRPVGNVTRLAKVGGKRCPHHTTVLADAAVLPPDAATAGWLRAAGTTVGASDVPGPDDRSDDADDAAHAVAAPAAALPHEQVR